MRVDVTRVHAVDFRWGVDKACAAKGSGQECSKAVDHVLGQLWSFNKTDANESQKLENTTIKSKSIMTIYHKILDACVVRNAHSNSQSRKGNK